METSQGPNPSEGVPGGRPHLAGPERHQMEWMPQCLNDLVPPDHPVRAVWGFIEKLDLTKFEKAVKVREGQAGRPAADPRVMLALWVYATAEGYGSGRELERLTQEHAAFRWLRGGVPLDYHTLNDFRTDHREAMDELLTQILGVLLKQKLVGLTRMAQDGTRVRASAGSGSFHRKKTLHRCLAAAREQIERLKREADHPDPLRRTRQEAVRLHAAQDREARIQKALEQLPELERKKRKREYYREEEPEARASSTDPDARVMKMPDGGFRPAYNVQLATDTQSQVILGVDVTHRGSDKGELPPMLDQIQKRTGQLPKEALVDGGFNDHASIEKASQQNVTVYAPVRASKKKDVDPHVPLPDDSPAVAEWKRRMATEAAKRVYKERGPTAECVNALAKEHRGLRAFPVRGLPNVLSVALLFAVAHNILRYLALTA